ncbi:two-component system response regulator [Marinomonas sp. UCMA 3892]|uniref:HD domain-containing phosphohydrolase n=1 Tax=unclassified Marinomonas TaxID=196814 RepID=UPI00146F58FB|nr:HD domain-containing phosphohydrolase [Marinomonas sp. UCMA 3892]NLU96521.1 two-component system response regulator [Marinomonas sp. UCMA 3892]
MIETTIEQSKTGKLLNKPTILIVDDTPENIDVLVASLSDEYTIKVALNGMKALSIASLAPRPDIILLDVMMPEMDGYDVCHQLKNNPTTANIPVIFVTAKHDIKDEEKGLSIGAVDYILKPISPPIVRARVRTHLALYDQNRQLQKKVDERTKALQASQLRIIHHLGRAVEFKDNETGAHVIRMSHYARMIAQEYGGNDEWVNQIFQAAPMHDVGKIGISDAILLKPGKLTPEEWEKMKLHTVYGGEIFSEEDDPMLKLARSIALTHHEKWDGSGYPKGLKGEEIPLEGRIVAIADVLDALMSKRPYKEPWTLEKSLAYIEENSGSHFDPNLVPIIKNLQTQIVSIRQQFPDSDKDLISK